MKKTIFALLIVTILLCIVLSACGTQKSDSKSEPNETPITGDTDQLIETRPEYPVKNVTMIVPYSAGGTADQVGRVVAEYLSKELNINITVVNKTGASGEIGALEIADSKNDGSVIGILNCPDILISCITNKEFELEYDKDVEYIATFNKTEMSFFSMENSKFETWDALVEYCKAHPGEVTVGNSGTAARVLAAAAMDVSDIDMTFVTFSGAADVVAALLGGHVDIACAGSNRAADYFAGGAIPLLWGPPDAPEEYPNPPRFSDIGMDAEFLAVISTLVVPAGVPDDAITCLESACAKIVEDQKFINTIIGLGCGYDPLVGRNAVFEMLKSFYDTIENICNKYADVILTKD